VKAHKILSAILFFITLALWASFIYLTFVLPKRIAIWEAAGQTLPTVVIFVVNLSFLCQRIGLVIVPVLLLLSIGAVVWFLIASIKSTKALTTG